MKTNYHEQAALAHKFADFFAAQASQTIHPDVRRAHEEKAANWDAVANDFERQAKAEVREAA